MFVALRRLTILVIVILFVLIAAVLAYGNPEPIDLDLGFARIENVSLTVVLAVTFALGAVFGVLFSVLTLVRHYRERRSLQRELRRTRTELSNSRSLALTDAD
jgi:uncharacterized membrane protein YciS (DUF1049 family)